MNKQNYIEEELLKFYLLSEEDITYSDIQGLAMVKAKEIIKELKEYDKNV